MTLAVLQILFAMLIMPNGVDAAPSTRPALAALHAADSVVVGEGSSNRKVTINSSALVQNLIAEFSVLDSRPWKQATIIKHGDCSVHVAFFLQSQWLMDLVVYRNTLYQASGGATHNPQFLISLAPGELPILRKVSSQLPKNRSC